MRAMAVVVTRVRRLRTNARVGRFPGQCRRGAQVGRTTPLSSHAYKELTNSRKREGTPQPAEEKKTMAGLPPRTLRWGQTRHLHSRTAERRGHHILGSWATADAKRVHCLRCKESCVFHQISSWKDFKCGVKKVVLPWSRPGTTGRLTTDHVLERRLAIVDDKIYRNVMF